MSAKAILERLHTVRWCRLKSCAMVFKGHTICLVTMQTVFIENFCPHMSNRSSKLGPRRMLCRPIIMISAMTRLCLDAQAPPNSGGAAMMVGGAAMMVGGVQ